MCIFGRSRLLGVVYVKRKWTALTGGPGYEFEMRIIAVLFAPVALRLDSNEAGPILTIFSCGVLASKLATRQVRQIKTQWRALIREIPNDKGTLSSFTHLERYQWILRSCEGIVQPF